MTYDLFVALSSDAAIGDIDKHSLIYVWMWTLLSTVAASDNSMDWPACSN